MNRTATKLFRATPLFKPQQASLCRLYGTKAAEKTDAEKKPKKSENAPAKDEKKKAPAKKKEEKLPKDSPKAIESGDSD